MRIFAILTFLIVNIHIQAQRILTVREVFDFDVNDEFHYHDVADEFYDFFPNAERIKILDKYYSSNQDTLFYKYQNRSYYSEQVNEPEPHIEQFFSVDTLLVSYTNLDSAIFLMQERFIYDSLVKNSYQGWSYDTIITTSSYPDLCDILINGFEYFDSDFEPNVYFYYYGEGIGLTRYVLAVSPSGPNFAIDNRLYYYKKGNETCGTPDLLTSERIIKNDLAKIYPNPSSDYVYLDIQDSRLLNSRLKVYNSMGRLVLDTKSGLDKIDISGFQSGTYYLHLQLDDNLIIRQILKH
jgi:hypothetical protein